MERGFNGARNPAHLGTVVAWLILLVVLIAIPTSSYIDTTNPHDPGDFDPGSEDFCRICHMGFLDGSAEVDRVTDNYRCIVCHYSLNQDYQAVVNATLSSPHRTVGCTRCHDTLHVGHTFSMGSYDDSTRGLFGCDRGHFTVTHDYNAPQNPTRYFLDTFYLNITASKSTNLVWSSVFYYASELPTGVSSTRVYSDAYIAPYNKSFDAIPPDKSYWVCMKCHFTNKAEPTTLTDTYWVSHTDVCFRCHSNTTGYVSIYNLEPHAVMNHPSTTAWDSCKTCHTNLAQAVANSIHGHAGVGCRCHSMVHVSKYNGSASWVYLYPSPATKDYVSPECTMCHFVHGATTDVTWWRTVFYYNSSNATTFNVPIYPFSAAGDTKYVNVLYLMRSGDATPITGPEMRWATCLNCHFIAGTSGGALPARFEGRIPLPKEALKNIQDPHSIQPLSTGNNGPSSRGWGFAAVVVALAAMAALIVLMGRARQ